MANIARFALIPAALAVISLTACGSPAPPATSYDPALMAAAVCVGEEVPDDLEDLVDRDLVVVPDNYCPIGDGPAPEGFPYWWAYSDALPVGSELDVPYVGSTIVVVNSGSGWSRARPPRVATLNLARGVYREVPSAGQSSVRYALAPKGIVRPVAPPTASSVQRGGLGVPNARATNAPTPVPSRALAVPGPTRAPAATRARSAPAAAPAPASKARVPARAPGPRPSAPVKTRR